MDKAFNRCGIISFVLVQDKLLGVDRQIKEGTLNQTGGFVKYSTHAHTLIDLTDVNDSLLMLIVVDNLLFWFKREVSAKWGNISIDKSHFFKFSASTSFIYFARSCRKPNQLFVWEIKDCCCLIFVGEISKVQHAKAVFLSKLPTTIVVSGMQLI